MKKSREKVEFERTRTCQARPSLFLALSRTTSTGAPSVPCDAVVLSEPGWCEYSYRPNAPAGEEALGRVGCAFAEPAITHIYYYASGVRTPVQSTRITHPLNKSSCLSGYLYRLYSTLYWYCTVLLCFLTFRRHQRFQAHFQLFPQLAFKFLANGARYTVQYLIPG